MSGLLIRIFTNTQTLYWRGTVLKKPCSRLRWFQKSSVKTSGERPKFANTNQWLIKGGVRDEKSWMRQCNYLKTSIWLLSLPPANEVWGKVIFLHLFVILFTGGAYFMGCLLRGECLVPGGLVREGGAWSWEGCLVPGVPGGDPPGWLLLWAVRILLECILV